MYPHPSPRQVFEVMSYLSTVSNLAVAVFTNTQPIFGYAWSWDARLAFFIAAEHCVLITKWVIERYIPDRSYSVRVQLQRSAYLVQKHVFNVDLAGTTSTLGGADAFQEGEGDESGGVAASPSAASPAVAAPAEAVGAAYDFRVADSYEDMVGARFRGRASEGSLPRPGAPA